MNVKQLLVRLGVGAALVAGVIALIAWWPKGAGVAAVISDTWTCSMHPQIRLPNPGRCPICGMQLIPVSKLPKAHGDLETRAGLVTEPLERRELFKEIRTVSKLDCSERQVAYISSRVAGRVDRLFVDFTGVQVKKGDHLVEIYSPDLLVAQNELLLSVDAVNKEKPSSLLLLDDCFRDRQRAGWQHRRHVQERAFVQGGHELTADAGESLFETLPTCDSSDVESGNSTCGRDRHADDVKAQPQGGTERNHTHGSRDLQAHR